MMTSKFMKISILQICQKRFSQTFSSRLWPGYLFAMYALLNINHFGWSPARAKGTDLDDDFETSIECMYVCKPAGTLPCTIVKYGK